MGCVLYEAGFHCPLIMSLHIELLSWREARARALPIRMEVFVNEQGVPAEMELDEWDAEADHALAFEGAEAVATGRLLHDGRIGRMAVRAGFRGRGYGAAVLSTLVDRARTRGMDTVFLHAQTHAVEFYRRQGFVETGPAFMEAGMPHQAMRQDLA